MLDGLKKKTQNLTGTMSLNSQISDLEKANAALYSQLGREYFKRWQTQPVPELAQIVAAIEANLNKAAQLNEEIKRLKEELEKAKAAAKNTLKTEPDTDQEGGEDDGEENELHKKKSNEKND